MKKIIVLHKSTENVLKNNQINFTYNNAIGNFCALQS